MTKPSFKYAVIALCAFGLLTSHHSVIAADNIDISAMQIDSSSKQALQKKYGGLYWRGGLVLNSTYKNFGGLSGIVVSSDGKLLLAISDRGQWLKANIVYKDGFIHSLTNAQMAPLLNAKGQRFKSWEIDSEGLTKRNNSLNDVVVSVERNQSLLRYKIGGTQLAAPAKNWGSINDAHKIKRNRGLEGVTSLPASHKYRGWMLATAEHKLDKDGNHSAWLVNGKKNHALSIKRYGGFDITEVNYLPNGDIVILERAISLLTGAQMQIRQICGRDVKPGALLDGKKLYKASWSLSIDNMEGLAVHKAANGETILTIISDDNFHFLQRNLILQFALADNKSVCK